MREHRAVTERVGLSVAAFQPVRRSHDRREHRVLRRDPWRARLPSASRSAARDDPVDAISGAARRRLSGGMKQKLALGMHARPRTRVDPARRADNGRRSRVAAGVLEAAVGVPLSRHHDSDVHAVSRRGRAVQPRRAAARGPAVLACDEPSRLRAEMPGAASLEDVFIARLTAKDERHECDCRKGRARHVVATDRIAALVVAAVGGAAQDVGARFASRSTRRRTGPWRRAIAWPRRVRVRQPRKARWPCGRRPSVRSWRLSAGYTRTNHVTEFLVPGPAGVPAGALSGRAGQLPDAARSAVADLQRRPDRRAGARGAGGGVGCVGRRGRGAGGSSARGGPRVLGARDGPRRRRGARAEPRARAGECQGRPRATELRAWCRRTRWRRPKRRNRGSGCC